MAKLTKREQTLLAVWAAACAEHVLPYFEKEHPKDGRPRKAVKACRAWARTGVFNMAVIRKASLSAHAAARSARSPAARFAARAAGQAVATAHVSQHAFGASYYALKIAASATNPEVKVAKELKWQSTRLPKGLRQAWQDWQSRRLPKSLRRLMKRQE